MLFLSVFCILVTAIFGRETYHPIIIRRRANLLGRPISSPAAYLPKSSSILSPSPYLRPVHMLLTEPIVGFICLYIACEFATLYAFFAAVPYTFQVTYGFSVSDTGLVFLSLVIGSLAWHAHHYPVRRVLLSKTDSPLPAAPGPAGIPPFPGHDRKSGTAGRFVLVCVDSASRYLVGQSDGRNPALRMGECVHLRKHDAVS